MNLPSKGKKIRLYPLDKLSEERIFGNDILETCEMKLHYKNGELTVLETSITGSMPPQLNLRTKKIIKDDKTIKTIKTMLDKYLKRVYNDKPIVDAEMKIELKTTGIPKTYPVPANKEDLMKEELDALHEKEL